MTRLECLRAVVHPWHHDHYGHMNVRHYAPFFDDAVYHFWTLAGTPSATMLNDHGVHTVSAKATTTFIKELVAGDLIRIDGAITRLGTKSATLEFRMFHADTGVQHAAYEVVEVLFDPTTRSSAPIPSSLHSILSQHLVEPS